MGSMTCVAHTYGHNDTGLGMAYLLMLAQGCLKTCALRQFKKPWAQCHVLMGWLEMQLTRTKHAYTWHRGVMLYVRGRLDHGRNAMAQCYDSNGLIGDTDTRDKPVRLVVHGISKALVSISTKVSLTQTQCHGHLDMAWAQASTWEKAC